MLTDRLDEPPHHLPRAPQLLLVRAGMLEVDARDLHDEVRRRGRRPHLHVLRGEGRHVVRRKLVGGREDGLGHRLVISLDNLCVDTSNAVSRVTFVCG